MIGDLRDLVKAAAVPRGDRVDWDRGDLASDLPRLAAKVAELIGGQPDTDDELALHVAGAAECHAGGVYRDGFWAAESARAVASVADTAAVRERELGRALAKLRSRLAALAVPDRTERLREIETEANALAPRLETWRPVVEFDFEIRRDNRDITLTVEGDVVTECPRSEWTWDAADGDVEFILAPYGEWDPDELTYAERSEIEAEIWTRFLDWAGFGAAQVVP